MAAQLGADNPSLAAVRTEGKIQTGERPQHVLPGFGSTRGVMFLIFGFLVGGWFLEAEEGPGLLQFGPGIGGGPEAVVPDFDKPRRGDATQKTAGGIRGGGGS